MDYVYTLNDNIFDTAWNGFINTVNNIIDKGQTDYIGGTQTGTNTGANQGTLPNPNTGTQGGTPQVSTQKQVSPLLLGGLAGGVIWFATKKPLFAGLAAVGTWFFTDKMNK